MAPVPPKPPSSGLRVAAGVLLILLGLIEFSLVGWLAILLVLGPGTVAAGIVLLCQHRSRKRGTPTLSMWLASAGLILGGYALLPFAHDDSGGIFLFPAIPALILLNKDWDRDRTKPSSDPAPEPTLT
jgi:uncharacterized membrane protein HdeD (DUF308 family)